MRVIGVGQPHRGDDAVGLVVADRVRALAPGIEVTTESADAAALLDALGGVDACIAIDAARSGGAAGTVLRLDGHRVVATRAGATSGHGNALADAIALGDALGTLPPRFRIVAVVGSNFRIGDAMSAAVEAAIPDAVAAALDEIVRSAPPTRGRN